MRYKGTVIGGVADGHVLEKDEPRMRVEIGVWAPEGVPLEKIIERLCKFYNPRTGLLGQPVANPMRAEVEKNKIN